MTVQGSTLLPLGLFLFLGLLLSSASSVGTNDNCDLFNKNCTIGPAIKVSPRVYARNKLYKVKIPANINSTSVVLQATDKSDNPVGTWQNTSQGGQDCKGSGKYDMDAFNSSFFLAYWLSPDSGNIASVKIQAITMYSDKNSTYSSVKLCNTTKSIIPIRSKFKMRNTMGTQTAGRTTARSKSLANIYSSPITTAIQILLVFLTSRLLF
ncbi:placenta-expressed transcript 1 protein [Orycteropus afer afer]|uniref:Placenta-expressed transcript 1 protein n=1 Tax=Orycteropus afer afer TaxID=1230840 RepID=A0A8B6ZL84_ORYAF|nr:placenta-expressed transcript 1 protein [Orycteropus afer afer]